MSKKKKKQTKSVPLYNPKSPFSNPTRPRSEADIQETFFEWTNYQPDSRLHYMFAIPNGARVSIGQAMKLKRTGLKAGTPDVFLPCPSGQYHGLFIEFKSARGHLSPDQKRFEYHAKRYGYAFTVAKSPEQAIAAVNAYLNLPE